MFTLTQLELIDAWVRAADWPEDVRAEVRMSSHRAGELEVRCWHEPTDRFWAWIPTNVQLAGLGPAGIRSELEDLLSTVRADVEKGKP